MQPQQYLAGTATEKLVACRDELTAKRALFDGEWVDDVIAELTSEIERRMIAGFRAEGEAYKRTRTAKA